MVADNFNLSSFRRLNCFIRNFDNKIILTELHKLKNRPIPDGRAIFCYG